MFSVPIWVCLCCNISSEEKRDKKDETIELDLENEENTLDLD